MNLSRTALFLAVLGLQLIGPASAFVAAATVQMRTDGTNTLLQLRGDEKDDWRIQASSDLLTWSDVTSFGTLLSGGTNAPQRSVGDRSVAHYFYRALKTAGLYDPSLFRTVSLTFTQNNWHTLLTSARTSGSNVYCSQITLDNGATNVGAGARYKGNTSFNLSGNKKSINVELDFANPDAHLMGYSTFNLNNAAADETLMREALYFTVMSQYTPCPKGAMARVSINGTFWGVYALVQQENGQLVKEWFPSNNGDRWRTPNQPMSGANSALGYLNSTNVSNYQPYYDLRTTNSPTAIAWQRLINAIVILNTTPTNQLRDKVEDVLAVDSWLWFLAIENVFADDDSYWNKGADYSFYYESESGRIHPLEHDGNEAFVLGDVQLSPVQGATGFNRPVLYRLLPINELRQRYLAHMRTVLQEYYNPTVMTPMINTFHTLSVNSIIADTNKNFTMAAYTNDLVSLRTFVTNRHRFLTTNAEVRPVPPDVVVVAGPTTAPTASQVPFVTAEVRPNGTNGLDSVWLYHRGKSYGRFTAMRMFDDGNHGDGAEGDAVFGAPTTNYPAGTKVRFYVEARSADVARAASFAPARAEQETFSYRVAITSASNSPVVINEVMASNTGAYPDPQGEFDDWIELHNITDREVDLTGHHLSDETNNPRKWAFPAGTKIPAAGFLIIWADEDGTAMPGLHASFKLSASEETVYFTDTDENLNAVLDSVTFYDQQTDLSYGRTLADPDVWAVMSSTPGAANP